MKKIIALVLSLVMTISVFGLMSVSAADDEAELYEEGNPERLLIGSFEQMFNQAKGNASGTYIVKLVKDVDVPNTKLSHTGAATVVIDGNGHTMKSVYGNGWGSNFEVGNADGTAYSVLTFRNVTIVNTATAATTLGGIIGLWSGVVNVENSTIRTNMINVFINRTEQGTANPHQINITNSTIISEGATANGGLIYATAKNAADYHIKATNSIFISMGAGSQNMILMESNSNCTAEGSHIMEFVGCKMYFMGQAKVGILVLPTSGAAPASFIVKDSQIYHSFIYGNSQNHVIIKNAANSKATIDLDNVDFYGGAYKGSAVTQNGWMIDLEAAGTHTNGITAIDYNQAGVNPATAKVSETMYLPTMRDGAAVRIAGDTSGIRFTTDVAKAAVDYYAAKAGSTGTVSYGTIVVLASELDKYGINATNFAGTKTDTANYTAYIDPVLLDTLGVNYLDIVADKGVVTNADNSITFRAAVKGFSEEDYGTELLAFSYAKIVDGENVSYYCSPVSPSDNPRSMKEVATAALADTTVTFNTEQTAILKKYAGITE